MVLTEAGGADSQRATGPPCHTDLGARNTRRGFPATSAVLIGAAEQTKPWVLDVSGI